MKVETEVSMNLTKDEIEEKIKGFLVDEFEVDGSLIQADASLRDTLGLDSLDYVDLVVIIESNFGFKVTGEDFASINTFQDFFDFVDNKLNG